MVVGSTEIFGDEYLDKEENSKMLEFFLKTLVGEGVELEFGKDVGEMGEYQYVPDIERLADKLKSCLQVRTGFKFYNLVL